MSKYNCNKSVFKEIKTEREAYWLGFILADGHNHQNKTLRVDIKDEGHLNDLSNLIYPEGDKPIKTRDLGFGTIYYFHCGVGEVVRNLSNHGIIPNKSKKAVLPIIPDEMYRHFIRGLYDGDGSLSFSYDGNYRKYTFSVVGNDELMIGLKKIISNQINVEIGFGKMKMIHRVYKRGNRQIMTILHWMYQDSTISLSRKNKKYQEMLEYYSNKKKK